ncbi:thiamine biosynthesis protein ThiI [Prauserella shujinwangii]|uniref:Probable tRNA sulfurtransferase n=1 Tax=Prauserella shujinwangii TaxID=1453103 RepID=A0A2T0M439_9PSEU|nr:tRNA uracil 4-sulfurtransferase ThiI [Prauserella shujinwangii]PRX51497.1 thiamine biosynthesis protein ThiI [Prauserella shujinwangii]
MTGQSCVLLKYGELTLKGRNRGRFEKHLLRNVERTVSRPDGERVRIQRRQGVLVLRSALPERELLDRARDVIGISVVQPAVPVPRTPDDVAAAAVRLVRERGLEGRFAVRARRRTKDFPLTSEELAAHVGDRVRRELGWPVDLDHPEVEILVEVDWREVFVSVERYRGQGGLPVGASGRALVLLSGGFDSPVAAYRAMRRGLRCDFVHFTGAPFTGPSSTYKAYAHVRELDRFQGGSRLHVIPIGAAQRRLAGAGAGEAQTVAHRRLMLRTADALARECGAQALVTGDSLGQVASQTLSNLATVERSSDLPLLRPLLAWDKDEIIAEARRIGTADIARLPDEDCCSLLTPPHPATRTTHERLAAVERRAGVDDLVPELLAKSQLFALGNADGPNATDGAADTGTILTSAATDTAGG